MIGSTSSLFSRRMGLFVFCLGLTFSYLRYAPCALRYAFLADTNHGHGLSEGEGG
jgi:hypothetical protein